MSVGTLGQAAPPGLTNRRDLSGSNFHPSLLQKAFLKPRRGGRLLWAPGAASLQLLLLGYNSTQDPAVIPLCPGQWSQHHPLHQWPGQARSASLYPQLPSILGRCSGPQRGILPGVNTNLPQGQRLRAPRHPGRRRQSQVRGWCGASFLGPGWKGSRGVGAGPRRCCGRRVTAQGPKLDSNL